MAKNLNLKVLAEGVETEDQLFFLRAHNCDELQGYYFSKPLSANAFSERARRGLLLRADLQTSTRAMCWAKVQLAREALGYSARNISITLEVFLLSDKRLIDQLLIARADNTQKISEIVAKLESQSNSPEEKQLLAALKDARTLYVGSYVRALHLLVDEKQLEAARAILVQETTPAFFKYHNVWNEFVRLQMERIGRDELP